MRSLSLSRRIRLLTVATAAIGTLALASTAIAATRTDRVCHTQTAVGANVYTACLTGISSYDGRSASGYVAGAYCNIFYPIGLGYFCESHQGSGRSWGAYYNRSLGAWEEWLNQRVNYISPYILYRQYFSRCIYLRIDVRPSGATTYQNFESGVRQYLSGC